MKTTRYFVEGFIGGVILQIVVILAGISFVSFVHWCAP